MKQKNESLYQAVLLLEDQRECADFFQDLCTVAELRSMEQRFQVASMLREGRNYNEILKKTGASSATISRVNRALSFGTGAYDKILSRMEPLGTGEAGTGEVIPENALSKESVSNAAALSGVPGEKAQ